MLDDFDNISSWITETKKKFMYFTSPVTYLMVALDHLQKLNAENNFLRNAIQELKTDIESKNLSGTISYDRQTFVDWLTHVLEKSAEARKKEHKNGA